MQQVRFRDLGIISYGEAWRQQQDLHEHLIALKRENQRLREEGAPLFPVEHHLLFCEHPPVFTLGRSGAAEHLLLDEEGLKEKGIEFYKINRGGDITFHGPGQVVGYPIFDLDYFFTDVHRYVRYLEEAVTGVWLPQRGWLPARKICAIGVHLSRWVTMHGFAFNVNTDLQYFRHIIPCGIQERDKDVTSLSLELGREADPEEVKLRLKQHLAELFGFEIIGG
jgi:lipoyl(octanoyl) transferase